MDWVAEMFHFIKEWWFLIGAFGGMIYGGYQGIKTINDTLIEIKSQLEKSNSRFAASERDRGEIWKRLYKHDGHIDELFIVTARHEERFNNIGGKDK